VQSGSARTPLIIAGFAALATYAVAGHHGPIGFLQTVGLLHHHTASASVTVDDDVDSDDADGQTASGPRQVAPFDRVVLTDNADATIEIGDTQTVNVTAPNGKRVKTDVHDGKLVVSGHMSGAHIVVTVPHLQSLEANGTTKVTLIGLKDSIKIIAHGPVDLTASGMVDSADLTLDGPSKLSMKTLETRNMTIRLNGMGDAEVFATETLTADVNGVGHVRYLGDPHTVSNIHGLGSVEKLQS
jgi:hypothetical protein